jgi:peptide/nickel transport system ATP-binding protein
MKELLKFDSAEISFYGNAVIHNVSFSVDPGRILCIVGESGSGKSTLLKAAIGLLGRGGMVTGGDILFKDKSIPGLSEKELTRLRGSGIGMVFQNAGASMCPVRTIGSLVKECMHCHTKASANETKFRAMELFERLGLSDPRQIWDSYPFELSGGMRQRTGIAMAMLMNPQLLLADEPTSALDAVMQKRAVEEMLKIRKEFGTAIVVVTHDIGVASVMADEVLVLKEGRVAEAGQADDVLSSPKDAYTKELLDAVPVFMEAV